MDLFCECLVLSFAIYGSCLHGDCVFDDMNSITSHPIIREGRWLDLWNQRWSGRWRILSRISLALNIRLGGLSPFSVHVGNVALHAVNGLILSSVLRGLGIESKLAALGALLFIGHPLCRDAVAYMSSRAVLLSTLFSFAALALALHGYWPLAFPLLWLAFMSKEDNIAAVPCIGLLLLSHGSWAGIWFFVAPLIAVAIYWPQIHHLMRTTETIRNTTSSAALTSSGFDPIQSRWVCFKTVLAELIFRFPRWAMGTDQNFDPEVAIASTLRFAASAMIVIAIAALFIEIPAIRTALILIAIAPMSMYLIVPLRDYVFEYRAYFSISGVVLILIQLLAHAEPWEIIPLCIAFWTLSAIRAWDYSTPIRFWSGCVRDGSDRKPRVLANLAAVYQFAGQDAEARKWTERVLEIQPDLGPSMVNLGLLEARAGHLDKARDILIKATSTHPKYPLAWQVLSEVYKAMNDPQQAAEAAAHIAQAGG